MVSTRGKKKSASSNRTLKENETAENALAETLPPDAVTVNVEELKVDAQLEDEVDTTVDEARNEKSEESERDESRNDKNEGISGEEESERVTKLESRNDNYEGMSGGEESERVTKLDNDYQNMIVEEISGVLKVELAENTSVDGQEEMEEDEENTEHDNEERVVDELDFSDEEATEEDNEDEERVVDELDFSDGDATEENNEDEQVSEEEVTEDDDEDEVSEEDGEEEKEIAKQDPKEIMAKEDGSKIEEHNIEKSDVRLKKNKKSIQTSRKKNVQADRSKKLDLKDKPESSRKRKTKKRVGTMGMIFMCNSKTKKDCYRYKVFGLPESKKDLVEKIYSGMRLFLYDIDLKLMYGIYKAAGPGGYNIKPKAFRSQFPSQVRFKVLDNCLPLAEEKFKNVIKDNYYTNTKFDCQLNSEQVKALCKLFSPSSKGRLPKWSGKGRKAEKLPVSRERTRIPVSRERTRRRRAAPERRLPLREEVQHERPRKRPRKVMSPACQHPAPPSRIVASTYAYERTSGADAYWRNPYLEHRSPYRDGRDQPLDRRDPYGDRQDLPIRRNDHHGDGRDPYSDRLYAYRDGRDPYVERRDPCIDDRERDRFPRHDRERDRFPRRRDPYRDGRGPYLELPNLYRDRQDPYVEGRASLRDGRDPYLERRLPYRDTTRSELPYRDSTRSELYGTYSRDPVSDRGVEYRIPYRREEVLERRDLHPSPSLENRPRPDIVSRDSYVPTREQPAYATEPMYCFIRY